MRQQYDNFESIFLLSVKGIMSPIEYFLKAYIIKSVLSVHAPIVFKYQPTQFNRKINMKFLLVSLKTLTNSKNRSESRIKFLFWLSLALIGRFFQCTFIAGFRNNFQDHRRVTEQLLDTHTAIRKPVKALWRGILEGISQLVSYFIEARRHFNLDFLYKKTT